MGDAQRKAVQTPVNKYGGLHGSPYERPAGAASAQKPSDHLIRHGAAPRFVAAIFQVAWELATFVVEGNGRGFLARPS